MSKKIYITSMFIVALVGFLILSPNSMSVQRCYAQDAEDFVGAWLHTNYLGNQFCAAFEDLGGGNLAYTGAGIASGTYNIEDGPDEFAQYLVKRSGGSSPCWVFKIIGPNRLENECDYGEFYELSQGECTYCYGDRDTTGDPAKFTTATRKTELPDGTGWPPFPTKDGDEDGVANDTLVIGVYPELLYSGISCDNCPDVANYDQVDTNGNGIGDACDEGITQPLPPAEPFQAVPVSQVFKTNEVDFSLVFDENGNSTGVVPCEGCTVTEFNLNDLKLDDLPIQSFGFDSPFGASLSPGCIYVRTRSGRVSRICN